jgi:hypothetical protein
MKISGTNFTEELVEHEGEIEIKLFSSTTEDEALNQVDRHSGN